MHRFFPTFARLVGVLVLIAAGSAHAQQCEYIEPGHQPYGEVTGCPGLPDFGFPTFEVPAAEVPCSVILQRIAAQAEPGQYAGVCANPNGSLSGPACLLETTPAYNRSGSCGSNKILGEHSIRAARLGRAASVAHGASDRHVQGGFPDSLAQLEDALDVETVREIAEVATRSLDQSWAYLGGPRFALHHPYQRDPSWAYAMCADVTPRSAQNDCENLMLSVGRMVRDERLPELLAECRGPSGEWIRAVDCPWARAHVRAWALEIGYHRFVDLSDPAITTPAPECRQQYCGPANGALDPDQIEQIFRLLLREPVDVDECGRTPVCGVWTTDNPTAP